MVSGQKRGLRSVSILWKYYSPSVRVLPSQCEVHIVFSRYILAPLKIVRCQIVTIRWTSERKFSLSCTHCPESESLCFVFSLKAQSVSQTLHNFQSPKLSIQGHQLEILKFRFSNIREFGSSSAVFDSPTIVLVGSIHRSSNNLHTKLIIGGSFSQYEFTWRRCSSAELFRCV